MLRISLATAVAAATVAGIVVALPANAGVTPGAPYTALTVDSLGPTFLAPPDGLVLDNTNHTMTSQVTGETVRVGGTDGHWYEVSATIAPPTGASLTVGTMETRSTADATHGRFSVDGTGGCSTRDGSVTISDLTRDGGNVITSLAAHYQLSCDGQPNIYGEVRFNSASPFVGATRSTNLLDFSYVTYPNTSAPQTVTFRSAGSTALELGTAITEGGDSASFLLSNDTCSGQTLEFDETCSVTVRAKPTHSATLWTSLVIPDNSSTGKRSITLTAFGTGSAPELTPSPYPIDFHARPPAETTPPKDVTIKNTGVGSVQVQTASIVDNPDSVFGISNNGCLNKTLAVGASCVIKVTATPASLGTSYQARLVVTSSIQQTIDLPMYVTGGIGVEGTYYPVAPKRIMDTRTGLGAPKKAVGPGGVVHLTVAGKGGLPVAGLGAVVLNVTVTAPTASSYLAVYPAGGTRPNVSSLNFPAGWTGANSVTVAVGAGGVVDIYNAKGNVQVIVDVTGFYAAGNQAIETNGYGGQFQPVEPTRLLDTRTDFGFQLPSGYYVTLPLDFESDNQHVRAFAVNITAVKPMGAGYLTAWNGWDGIPETSTVNFTTGKVVPNMAIVPTSICQESDCYGMPQIAVYNGSKKSTDVLVDIVGYFDDGTLPGGLRFQPITPVRVADTRIGQGAPTALGPNTTATITTPDEVAGEEVWALATNVTAVAASRRTFLTVWPNFEGEDRPTVSNLNPDTGQTVPNAVITLVGYDEDFNVYNSAGTVNVLVDVVGTFHPGAVYTSFGLKPTFKATMPSTTPKTVTPQPAQLKQLR